MSKSSKDGLTKINVHAEFVITYQTTSNKEIKYLIAAFTDSGFQFGHYSLNTRTEKTEFWVKTDLAHAAGAHDIIRDTVGHKHFFPAFGSYKGFTLESKRNLSDGSTTIIHDELTVVDTVHQNGSNGLNSFEKAKLKIDTGAYNQPAADDKPATETEDDQVSDGHEYTRYEAAIIDHLALSFENAYELYHNSTVSAIDHFYAGKTAIEVATIIKEDATTNHKDMMFG